MAVDFKDFQKLKWYYQIAIVAAVCAGGLGLLWYQFLTPIETDIAARTKTLAEVQGQVAKAIQQQRVFEQFKKESADLQIRLDQLKNVLPQQKQTDEIVRQVQSTAANSGLRIMRIATRPIIDHEVYTEWPIDMEVVGTYHNIGLFLDRIRQLPRIFNVSGLSISSRASTGDAAFSASVGATYTATTFVYREEIATAAPAATPAR